MSLKEEKIRQQVARLHAENVSHREIAAIVQLPKTTITDFLSRRTYSDWWQDYEQGKIDSSENIPKMVTLDIETSPMLAWVWGLWDQNVALNQIERDWEILCCAYSWLHEEETRLLTARESFINNDPLAMEEFILSLWALLDNCDIAIGHNARRFDIKKIKAKFAEWKLPPPSPFKVVDTLEIVKNQFAFTSNKQEYLAVLTGAQGKMSHDGMPLWIGCVKGDPSYWDQMEEYNIRDNDDLRHIYLELRGWDNKHPNLQLYYNDGLLRCGTCGSEDMVPVDGKYAYTGVSKFSLFKCNSCGAYKRDGVNVIDRGHRKATLRNVA